MKSFTRFSRSRGLSLVEVLLSLAICAILMVALTTALSVGLTSTRTNDSHAKLAMRGRGVLMRLLGGIRKDSKHEPHTKNTPAYQAFVNQGLSMKDTGVTILEEQADGTSILYKYWWDADTHRLMVEQGNGGQTVTTTALNGVSDFSVTLWPGKSERNRLKNANYDVVNRAAVVIKISDPAQPAGDSLTLSGSAVPRQNVWLGPHLSFPIDLILSENRGSVQ